jgi:hypothetical protein
MVPPPSFPLALLASSFVFSIIAGINLPLAFVGQEYVWQKVYESMGCGQSCLDAFFTGPAYLPWQRMGNVYGWVSLRKHRDCV